MNSHRYFVLHKPANMLSQFVGNFPESELLGSINYPFPEGIHAIGRLDKNTEGLLLLTTDKRITSLLFHTPQKHVRTYLVMVKNVMSEEVFHKLQTGVTIEVKGGESYTAVPAEARIVEDPFEYYPYAEDPRSWFPHTWLLLSLTEGKYRQVRKMVYELGHRCFRLIRLSIEGISLEGTRPGEVRELSKEDFFRLLKLNDQ